MKIPRETAGLPRVPGRIAKPTCDPFRAEKAWMRRMGSAGLVLFGLACSAPAQDSNATTASDRTASFKKFDWNGPPEDPWITLGADMRYPLTGDYESFYGARLNLGFGASSRHSFALTGGAGVLRLESGSRADRGAHDPVIVDIGLLYRLYFTPPQTRVRPYGTAHLGVTTMFWDYREDPFSHGNRIWQDNVSGGDAFVGAGAMVNLSRDAHFFAEMGYGGMGFLDTTYHDLKNDLFDSFGYVSLKTGFGLSF